MLFGQRSSQQWKRPPQCRLRHSQDERSSPEAPWSCESCPTCRRTARNPSLLAPLLTCYPSTALPFPSKQARRAKTLTPRCPAPALPPAGAQRAAPAASTSARTTCSAPTTTSPPPPSPSDPIQSTRTSMRTDMGDHP